MPWLHGCHATRHAARHAEGRGYGRGRVGGLNDEPSKRFGLTALAVMLWLIIAFKVLKVMEIVLFSSLSLSVPPSLLSLGSSLTRPLLSLGPLLPLPQKGTLPMVA